METSTMSDKLTMEAQGDGWNLVVLGHFNTMILTPRFCTEHLAKGEVTVDVPNHAKLPPRLNFDGVSLLVVDGRLVVAPHSLDASGLAAAEKVSAKVMELLPHTPVTGTGVNLQWTLPNARKAAAVLAAPDADALSSAGAKVDHTVVRRRLVLGKAKLGLVVESDDAGPRVSVNFHHDTPSTAAVRDALIGKTRRLLTQAESLVQKLYG
jgi:hypothetical protein